MRMRKDHSLYLEFFDKLRELHIVGELIMVDGHCVIVTFYIRRVHLDG